MGQVIAHTQDRTITIIVIAVTAAIVVTIGAVILEVAAIETTTDQVVVAVETTTILAEEATTRARTVVKTTETTGIMIGGIAEVLMAGETMIEVAGTEEVLDTMTSAMMDRLVETIDGKNQLNEGTIGLFPPSGMSVWRLISSAQATPESISTNMRIFPWRRREMMSPLISTHLLTSR